MARISVFLNSQASQGNSCFSKEDILKFFIDHELTIHSPVSLDDLNQKLSNVISNGVDYIFSVGGDGTVNTISQQLVGRDIKLMVLPAGTANDFATENGITKCVKKASQIFQLQLTKRIDAININGTYMMSNGGLGIACEVAKSVNNLRKSSPFFKKTMKLLGKQTYSLIYAYKMIVKPFSSRSLFIESHDSPLLDKIIRSPLILINNQEYIGGKFRVAPSTRNDDGKFNVTLFLHTNKIDLMKCTIQMLLGIYPKNDKNLVAFETDKLLISAIDDKPLEFFGDGETFSPSKFLDITIKTKALEVCGDKQEVLYCPDLTKNGAELNL